MTLTLHRTYAAPSAGTPKVTVNKGNCNKAPLLVEWEVDLSGCTFDNTENYDALFDEDFTGRTHSPEKHRLLYIWDLDDDVADWTAPENIPAAYVNRSKALGAKVQHVYTTAQKVNWKLEILEPSSGKKAYASGSFTVDDALETADHIVLVNPNGDRDFTEIKRAEYPGATFHEEELASGNAFTNGTAAFTNYTSLPNVCWLFKTGGTYLIEISHPGGSGLYPYIGQYGTTSSARPVATVNGVQAFSVVPQAIGGTVAELRIQDFVLQGNWTDFAKVSIPHGISSVVGLVPKGGWRHIVADSEFRDIAGQAIRMDAQDGETEIHIAVANSVLHNIMGREYPVIIGNASVSRVNNFCFVGNRYTDEGTLISAPNQGTVNGMHRAFIRHNTPTHIHVRGCDFFRLAGGHGQPVMKLNKASRSNGYLGVQFCAGEGSENFVNFVEDKTGQPIAVNNAGICECCVFLHLPEGQQLAGATSTGNTLRSCLLVSGRWRDPALSQGSTTYRSRGFITPGGIGIYPTGDEAPNEVYNCHAVHLRTQAQNGGKNWGSNDASYNMNDTTTIGDEPQRFRYAGTFVHAPYQTDGTAVTAFAPIKDDPTQESDGILRPDGTRMRFRFKGWNPAGTPDPTYSYNGEFVPSGEFRSGSPGVGAGFEPLTWPLDYLGRICGPRRAHGASDDPGYVFDLKVRAG